MSYYYYRMSKRYKVSKLSVLLYVDLPVSHIWALIVFPSTWILLVANSTPMVDFDSKLNSLRVKRDSRFDLPTPESPIKTTMEN